MKRRIIESPPVRVAIVLVLGLLALAGGCSAPPSATLDLITQARRGLAEARDAQSAQCDELVNRLADQQAAMDTAFDADVRLAAAGQIKDAQGQPVSLSAQWVISARKGYIAARDEISKQVLQVQQAHAARLDNLQASDEALDMACQLILQQQGLANRIQQQLLNAQRSLIHGK